ncbi:PDR/VanB family oxidoreductase [Rhodococcus sp. IEGM 1307]|uniref:PDR/VanB family oxidoreductase n=1 Tax=Rhodococcus sp. IEGM 1307 TaxID=3047091 RepID=UPI0032D58713
MTGPQRLMTVTRVSSEAEGILSLELRNSDGTEVLPWDPGSHIDLWLPSGLIRQYSLCSDPKDLTHYRISVLRVADGRGGSVEIHDGDLLGRELSVQGPRNHFPLIEAKSYLLIAGGIGVTPLLAMARELDRRGQDWSMIYGGRSRGSMAYLDELSACEGDVEIVPQDERGIPDLARAIGDCPAGTAVYCCGPEPMLVAVQDKCAELLSPDSLHLEHFSADPAALSALDQVNAAFEVEMASTGEVLEIPPDRSILDVVLERLPGTPFSCKEGYCGTCETAVFEGTPDHRDTVLTPEERTGNETIMICVSRAESTRLRLDL